MRTTPSTKYNLDYLFHPESVAIIGVAADLTKPNYGQEFLLSLINAGFRGKIYPVGRGGEEILGLPMYQNLKEIPDRVDYVIVAIPARFTLELVADSAAKGVKVIHFFTAGYSELGDAPAKEMEREMVALARQHGIRLIGPNGMGIYYPKGGLAFKPDFTQRSGALGFIAQSGGHSTWAIQEGAQRGVFFSKVVSYGNAADLNETDFLEYLTADAETRTIAMYIEGVKNGRRFLEALKTAAAAKPVIIFKGGTTESGRRAAASHTASLAGAASVWHTLIKQAGAIQVNSVEEIIDLALLFEYSLPPKGRNTAIIGPGGGSAVLIADTWANAGLTIPAFPPELRQQLFDFFGREAGGSFKNPVDIFYIPRTDMFREVLRMVMGWDQVHLSLLHLPLPFINSVGQEVWKANIASMGDLPAAIKGRLAVTPHMAVTAEDRVTAARLEQEFYQVGIPTFPSAQRAATALSRFIRYYERRGNG